MPGFLASPAAAKAAQLLVNRRLPISMVVTLMLPLVYNLVEVVAFALLIRHARRGYARDISAQTCFALAVGPTIDLIKKFYWFEWEYADCQHLLMPCASVGWWLMLLANASVVTVAWCCSWQIWKNNDVHDEDNLLCNSWPCWTRWSAVYVAAGVVAFVVSFVVSRLTHTDLFGAEEGFAMVATFENFLHGFALIPQLLLSRSRGFVAPEAVQFLLILGMKHVLEFAVDFWNSSFAGRPGPHNDASCLMGDLLSSLVLMDFMYLWSLTAFKVGVRKMDGFVLTNV